jgi:hypothetical protein
MLFTALVGMRLFFFHSVIDEPHSWRQYDTLQYIRGLAFYDFDLFNPVVAWMGGHKVQILEFPLPEAITAVFYKLFGENLIWARLTTLLFFVGSALYLRGIIRRLQNKELADIATLIFMALPLGIPYSRAIHIDPAALFLAHAACYHAMKGIAIKSHKNLIFSSLMAILAAMVKVPYLFYLALPLGYYLAKRGNIKQEWNFMAYAIPPVLALILWTWHTKQVNASAPDWDFIPGYHKFVDMSKWYFGPLYIRWDVNLWMVLAERLRWEILGGTISLLIWLATFLLDKKTKGLAFFRIWTLGCAMYLVIFFPLNVIHNYYQLPFLVPAAIFLGAAVVRAGQWAGKWNQVLKGMVYATGVIIFSVHSLRLIQGKHQDEPLKSAFGQYFKVNPAFSAFGDAVRNHVPEGDLMIASYGGLDCRAPHLLVEAQRFGWNIPTPELNAVLVDKLIQAGALHLAVMDKPNAGKPFQKDFDASYELETVRIPAQNELPEKEVRIYHLSRPAHSR